MAPQSQQVSDSLAPQELGDGARPVLRRYACSSPIRYVDMHTTGEPTRIVYQGYPDISGNLLHQRAQAKSELDHIRMQLMWEPRGHRDMYGAILRTSSELVNSGAAHIAVLFMHNEGYSTMCGHATLALGRFLVDTEDESIFPRRKDVSITEDSKLAVIHLHAPCGLVEIRVPLLPDMKTSDPSSRVSFSSVPSFAAGLGLELNVPDTLKWPSLREREKIRLEIAYGGAFYCFVTSSELGFPTEILQTSISELSHATRQLKTAVMEDRKLSALIEHPDSKDLGFLYGVVVIENPNQIAKGEEDTGVNLCFFADQQVDRSPTGSAVSARAALAFAKGELKIGETRSYQSVVSARHDGMGSFKATPVQQVNLTYPDGKTLSAITVEVQGQAFYIAFGELVVEEQDIIGRRGFLLT